MRPSIVVAAAVLSFTACVPPSGGSGGSNSDPPEIDVDTYGADHGAYPYNYEELVKEWGKRALKDPYSAHYESFSRPRKEYMIENSNPFFGYSLCVGINAKNSYGGYGGQEIYWFMIRDGVIVRDQSTEGFPGMTISRGHRVNCADGPEPPPQAPAAAPAPTEPEEAPPEQEQPEATESPAAP